MRIAYVALISLLVLITACENIQVTSFEECVAAGNAVMESHPRQCRHNDQLFVEKIVTIPEGATECTSRSDFCTQEYNPVCGFFDETINCVKEPYANTYSNGCTACSDETVKYWVPGECEP